MKKILSLKKNFPPRINHQMNDIQKLVDIASDYGYALSHSDAEELWEDYSSRYNQEWVPVYPNPEVVWSIIRDRTIEEGLDDAQQKFPFP